MGVGQQHKKVAFIIQARMQSTRLPGKILLPLPLWEDKPMLLWIVEALKNSTYGSQIFVATSENKENDVLEDFCRHHEINCFRGDEDDVLSRFTGILRATPFDIVVRLTADNPFVDVKLLDETIGHHLANNNQYTKTTALPLGMNFEVVDGEALTSLESQNLSDADKEHVTLFLRNDKAYKTGIFQPKIAAYLKDLRLTIDYASDLVVASSLIAFSIKYNDLKGISLIEKVHELCPALFSANALNVQKQQFSNKALELEYSAEVLQNLELHSAAAILRKHE